MSAVLEKEGRTQSATVLVVDDDPWVYRRLEERLSSAHYHVHAVASAAAALEAVAKGDFDVILLDVGLPDESGLEALRRLKADSVSAGVVMISGEGDAQSVVEALRLGALDYLTKPLDPDKVAATIGLAARAGRLERENHWLSRRLRELAASQELVGCSPAARRLASAVRRVADSEGTVLIEGRPGSGKSTVVDIIHRNGRRSGAPLVIGSGEALTAESLDDHLEAANRGTLLIEDVDLLPSAAQSRLVRYLKERSNRNTSAGQTDVRVVATTCARLPELVARGKLREDLYYRLNVFPIAVPSLQERRDDIALLALHFLKQAAEADGIAHKGLTAAAMNLLESHPWPNNVAQLQHAVARAHALAGGKPVDTQHLLGPSTGIAAEDMPPPAAVSRQPSGEEEGIREEDVLPFDAEEKRLLARALKATKGNVRRAAQLLRIGRATLYRKIQVYKLKLQ